MALLATWVNEDLSRSTATSSSTRASRAVTVSNSSISPIRNARAESISSPVNIRCLAADPPITRTARSSAFVGYTIPNLAGVMPNTASSLLRRISQAVAIETPPPTQLPRMTAIVGPGKFANASSAAQLMRAYSPPGPFVSSVMSAPAQKWSPVPRTTRTRMSG